MERWIEICRLDDIPPLGARVVTAKGGNIALFRGAGDEVYGLDDRCPHKGGPLSQGIVHGERITCPLHNWVMELKSSDQEELARPMEPAKIASPEMMDRLIL